MYKKFYNLIILLICVGAFPVQVLALSNVNNIDSSICYFNENNSDDNNKQIIKCDHCDYYYDIDSNQNSTYIFPTNENILVTRHVFKKNFLNYIFSSNPRSPPLV